ncbi:unnamed protein product, partial [Sphagnum troendelagicum]
SSSTDSANGSNVATCIFHPSSFQSLEQQWRSSSYYCAEDAAPGPPNNRSRAMLTVAMEAASSFSPCLLGSSKL